MRCQSCNKFVAYDDVGVDDVEAAVDEDTGELTVTGRAVLPCAECGEELKSLDIDYQEDLSEEFPTEPADVVAAATPAGFRHVIGENYMKRVVTKFEADLDICANERSETKRLVRGKWREVKHPRTFKGVTVGGTVTRTITYPELADDGGISDTHRTVTDAAEFSVDIDEEPASWDEV